MPNNIKITDVRPNNSLVNDIKPNNTLEINNKPNNGRINIIPGSEQVETVNIGAGQPIGLLLSLVYEQPFSVTTSRIVPLGDIKPRYIDRTISAGQPMGLLWYLTQKADSTFTFINY